MIASHYNYGTGHRRPAPRARQPRDGTGSCGSQPAYQSLLDRRLQRRPLPCAILNLVSAAEPIGRRTLMSYALEKGHESGRLSIQRGSSGKPACHGSYLRRKRSSETISAPPSGTSAFSAADGPPSSDLTSPSPVTACWS